MINMKRFKVIDEDLMRPYEQPHGIVPDEVFVEVVLASDAEAAIAAAERKGGPEHIDAMLNRAYEEGFDSGERDMLARLTSEEAHAVILKVLSDEGAASEGGWHSWRCFDKGRYPEPCRCTEYVVDRVIAALRALEVKP